MKVILREQVPHLGNPGAIVNVKPGFARNYLLPQGLAAAATSRNIGMIEQLVLQDVNPPGPVRPAFNEVNQAIQEKERGINEAWAEYNQSVPRAKGEAEQVKAQLAALSVTVAKPVGENDRLFGSVTAKDVEKALAGEGVTVDRRKIAIAEPIKALGVYTVGVKLHGGLIADLKVWVVKE